MNFVLFICLSVLVQIGQCIKCFQCSSTEDQRKPTGVWSEDHYTQNRYEDNCGVYWPFEPERNVPVECNSDESHTPGTFCVKITKQGPRGFICKFCRLLSGLSILLDSVNFGLSILRILVNPFDFGLSFRF